MFKFKPFLYVMAMVLIFSVLGMESTLQGAGKKISGGKNSVADPIINSSGINWIPRLNFDQIILTVSRPDGSVIRRTFENNSSPYIDLSSIVGNSNECDGLYTYELRVVLVESKKMRDQLRDQRKNNQNDLIIESAQAEKPITQTGYFTVKGGSIITSTGMAEKGGDANNRYSTEATYNEDLYVKGNLCVGVDCSDPETWSYDTLRLKENNLRINFDDTSATSAYPANDWSIVINDIEDGGANYFAITDETADQTPLKIEAGAPDNSLYIEDYGRVGLKTSTPSVELHIVDGDSPALRLEQDTSSGWTAQVWDIAGNEANFFIRDVTNSSKLPFRIQPGAPSSSLCIKSDGKIGIGTWSPAFPMELDTTGVNAAFVVKRTDGATNYINATDSYANFGSTTSHPLRLVVGGSWRMRLNTDNSITMSNGASLTAGGVWTNASSRSLKENIQGLSSNEAMDTLKNLNPVKYNYKADKEENHVGFIAEDAPELVASKDKKGMSPMDVVAVLTKVVQEQQKTIAELQEKVTKLEKEKQ